MRVLRDGDNHVVSLNATTGKETWSKALATSDVTNFSTAAPIIDRNHLILGVGGDSILPEISQHTMLEDVRAYGTHH